MTRLLIPLVILLAVALPGCGGTPTQIEGGTMIFEGMVETLGRSTHSFTVSTEGGVRVEVLSVTAIPELEVGVPNLGIGVGQPLSDGECGVTFASTALDGAVLSLGLQERTYCLALFDNGTMAEDALRIYVVQVSPAA